MKVYNDVKKEYGPYLGKDGRLRVFLLYNDGSKKTISYPKYIMEKHLNRYLEEDETIDHIDGNPLNNDIDNLRVLPRKEHCKNDAVRNENITVNCSYCGKEFTILGNTLHYRNRKDRYQSGYFCSRQCSGKYGREIQFGLRERNFSEKIEPKKYSLHNKLSAPEETQDVESP